MELITNDLYPLTFGQQFLVQRFEMDPKNAFPLQRIYRLQDSFDYTAFKESVTYLINKHPSLRLRLLKSDVGWGQKFIDQSAVVSMTRVRGITKSYRMVYGILLMSHEVKPALNLEKDSPVRITVFRLKNEFYLSLCIDHIAADEISFGIFERELVDHYIKAAANKLIASFPSDSFQNFICNEYEKRSQEQGNLNFWCKEFVGVRPLEIPVSKKPYSIASKYINILKDEDFERLMKLTIKYKYSILTVIVAMHLLIIYESRKINDIVLSIPISNRIKEEHQLTVANIFIPLHIRFIWKPEDPITKILNGIRTTLFNAIIHSQYNPANLVAFVAQNNSGRVDFSRECNFIAEDDVLDYPNDLFIERIDEQLKNKEMLPPGGLNFNARKIRDNILFKLMWDGEFWNIKPEYMNTIFYKTFNHICSVMND
jgi:hypothetical protein